mmetsp:Transcript_106676/g.189634  ORF Transcript_106676/g.189634 Transcript_106676/m.189634 type:complete len:280 (+) Transcript_106676:204-1043(+)
MRRDCMSLELVILVLMLWPIIWPIRPDCACLTVVKLLQLLAFVPIGKVMPSATHPAILPRPDVLGPIGPGYCSLACPPVVLPFPDPLGSTGNKERSLAIPHVELPFSFVLVPVGPSHRPLATLLVVLPLPDVLLFARPFGPIVTSVSVHQIAFPLANIRVAVGRVVRPMAMEHALLPLPRVNTTAFRIPELALTLRVRRIWLAILNRAAIGAPGVRVLVFCSARILNADPIKHHRHSQGISLCLVATGSELHRQPAESTNDGSHHSQAQGPFPRRGPPQ